MKKCPTCDKDFPDSMRFCQTDGTLLLEKVENAPNDPYKTVVGNQSEIASAIPPVDPFKTMVASSPKKPEDDLLQLPDESDALKTMIVPQGDLMSGKSDDASPLDLPPPAQYAPSAPLIQPKAASGSPVPTPPKADPLPNFDQTAEAKKEEDYSSAATAVIDKDELPSSPASPFDVKPFENDFSNKSPYGNQENKPIPSPFDLSMPPGYLPPSMNPFNNQKSPAKDYSEPIQPIQSNSPSPFDAPQSFGQSEPFDQPLQQAEWTPPPAPEASWQNQQIGANTPFQPPVVGSGQNQTLAIVSLVCGILGIVCCGLFTGIPAIITGYMAKNHADKDPSQYTGRGLAIAGMIMGGISILFSILGIIYYVVILASASRY